MIKILLLLLSFSQIALATDDMILSVDEVYDGDTIKTTIPGMPTPLNEVSIRVNGIDTPEKPAKSYSTTGKLGRAKCVKEAELSLQATTFLRNLIISHGNVIIVADFDWGKYGGRIVGDVFLYNCVNNERINIGETMIRQGFAVEYHGGRKTKDWCE